MSSKTMDLFHLQAKEKLPQFSKPVLLLSTNQWDSRFATRVMTFIPSDMPAPQNRMLGRLKIPPDKYALQALCSVSFGMPMIMLQSDLVNTSLFLSNMFVINGTNTLNLVLTQISKPDSIETSQQLSIAAIALLKGAFSSHKGDTWIKELNAAGKRVLGHIELNQDFQVTEHSLQWRERFKENTNGVEWMLLESREVGLVFDILLPY
jgi:hypothetical protein